MRTRVSCVLALMAALAVASPAISQTDAPTQTVSGVVVSSTNDSLVVRTDDGTERTFKVDAQTNLPTNLGSGTRVTVAYHRMEGGVDHAARVTSAAADTGRAPQPREPMRRDDTARGTTEDPNLMAGDQLPATAGPVPQLVLVGLGALVAGLGLRRASRRA